MTRSESFKSSLSLTHRRELDAVCDRFDDAWRYGEEAQLEDYLAGWERLQQDYLVRELLRIELEYRSRRGERPELETFERRLPEFVETVRSTFWEIARTTLPAREPASPTVRPAARDREDSAVVTSSDRNPPPVAAGDGSDVRLASAAVTSGATVPVGHASVPVDLQGEIDDFELLDQLGKGAFATVFLARQRSLQRIVALKVSAHGSNEPRTMAQLDHRNIVRVLDQRWLPDRRLRLVYMEYVPGGTLQEVVHRAAEVQPALRGGQLLREVIQQSLETQGTAVAGGFPSPQMDNMRWDEVVCDVGMHLAAALDYAHQRGVLHRDIKPANILLTGDGTPKLVDFNISYSDHVEGASPAAYFGGSLAYMSPEQLEACDPERPTRAADLDGRSDIYALGIVLWELAQGKRPFEDPVEMSDWLMTVQALTAQRWAGVPADAAEGFAATCPAGLRDVLLTCMAPHRKDRFPSGKHLARQLALLRMPDLHRLLHPPAGHWRRWVVRWPLLFLVLAALIPNVALSAVNLFYNIQEIVGRVSGNEQRGFFNALNTVNSLAYGVSTLLCLLYLWPVLRGLRQIRSGVELNQRQWQELGPRSLAQGTFAAAVILCAWIFSGVAFPLVMDMQVPGGAMDRDVYLHFLISQTLHGLMVASLSFFFLQFLVVRAIYPALMPADPSESTAEPDLAALQGRLSWFAGVLGIVPLLAIGALAVMGGQQHYFVLLAALGLVGFLVAMALNPVLRTDLDRLRDGVRPTPELMLARHAAPPRSL